MSIVDEIRQDREKGAKRLESEYKVGLMALARRFCADESDANELVNRTFAIVVENIDSYLEQSAFFGWMSRILVNCHSKDMRRKSNEIEVSNPSLPEEAEDDDACARVFRAVDASLLRDAIEQLPPEIKHTLMMRYFMDMPIKDVARVLAVPSGTVMWRLHYARQILAAKLGANIKKPVVLLVAAALFLMASAAVVVGKGNVKWRMENGDLGAGATEDTETIETTGTTATTGSLSLVPDVSIAPDVPEYFSQSIQQGATTMTGKKAAAAALTAAMAAAPLVAANGEEYQEASSPRVVEVVHGKIGLGETGGMDVQSGDDVVLSGGIAMGDGGCFHKTGGGTLTIPMENVNRRVSGWELRNLGGTMRLVAGEDTTYATATPVVISQKAALWFSPDSAIVTNGTSGAAYVKRWVDVRDIVNPDSPSRVYAVPAWGSKAATYAGIPPVKVEKDGRAALYFNGHGSCQFMRMSAQVAGIRQNFVVHGMYGCWGTVLGNSTTRVGMIPETYAGSTASPTAHFTQRSELVPAYASARFHKDGVLFDPFTTPPSTGFQLLECDFHGKPDSNNQIFRCGFETVANGDTDIRVQGGDYVSEIILFTNVLTEAERLDVERYLMCKWSLPTVPASRATLPVRGYLASASNTVTELHAAADESLPPLDINGDGTFRKTGAGVMELGPSAATPFTGTFVLEEGKVFSRGGRPLPLTVKSGDRFTSSVHTPYKPEQSRVVGIDGTAGAMLSRTNAAEGQVAKDGDDWLRVNAVEDGVKRIVVNAGVCVLESRSHGRNYVPNAPAAIVVSNGDFEQPFLVTGDNGVGSIESNAGNGWRKSTSTSDKTPAANYVAWTNSAAKTWFRTAPSSGAQALQVNGGHAAVADVNFPADGWYDVTFRAEGRYGTGISGRSDSICRGYVYFGTGEDTGELVGLLLPHGLGFGRYRFRLPYVTAGVHSLRFRGRITNDDGTLLLDDLAIHAIGKYPGTVAFKVPNGDFESIDDRAAKPRYIGRLSAQNVPTGWTLDISGSVAPSSLTNSCVGLISPAFAMDGGSTMLAGLWNMDYGSTHLFFHSRGGTARTTFTAPKGTFRLRADMARSGVYITPDKAGNCDNEVSPAFHATLTLADGTSIDLGTVVRASRVPTALCWPNGFEISSEQTVTLAVTQTNNNGCGWIDNLVFLAPDDMAEVNLLACADADGDFTLWRTSADKSYFVNSYANRRSYDFQPNNYGYSVYDGSYYFVFQCRGTLCQTVRFPAAGLYRFKCHARTRGDKVSHAGNAISIWYAKTDSAITNIVDTMPMPYSGNFLERAWLLNVPEAGEYTFGLSGIGVREDGQNSDRETHLDGLSLSRVSETVDAAPRLPRGIKIDIAEGARLVLDFPGVIRTGTIRMGNRRENGVITAQSHPDYIGGTGTIESVPEGSCISFR